MTNKPEQTGDIQSILQQHFGFGELPPGQQAVIQHLLDGHSAADISSTGAGKSLCYQLPALLLSGVDRLIKCAGGHAVGDF